MGGQPRLDNGEFTSPNRFVAIPPREVALFGSQLPVRYNLDSTSIKDIVLHPSAGLSVRLGDSRGPWAGLSYAYEPANRIALGYEGYLFVGNQDVEVTLHPRVVYRHLAGVDCGYEERSWSSWLSAMIERPVDDGAPDSWTKETLTPAWLVSAAASFDALGHGDEATRLGLGFIHSRGGVSPDVGPLATPNRNSIFESRYPYRDAADLRVTVPLARRGLKRLTLSSRSVYEFTVSGVLLSMDLAYQADDHWSMSFGADALGSAREQAPVGGADFFNLYRADDRVRGKVSYYF
jgi:hypothetical protein